MDIKEQIAKNLGMKLIDCKRDTNYPETVDMEDSDFDNCSFFTSDEIILGFYDDDELQLISFFHEVGHLIIQKIIELTHNKYDIEYHAWNVGFKIAHSHGICFSRKAKRWAIKQLNSYKYYEND